nr:hypothetical protein [Tanacetum cinerariifolium]
MRKQKSRRAKQDGIYQLLPPKQESTCRGTQKNSIEEKEVLAVVEEEGHTNMTPIYEYLTEEILPEEKRKTRATRRKAGGYAVTNGILYKKSFLRPWLRCPGPLQANYVLREIHEGSCSMHAGSRSVVAKALRSGFSHLSKKVPVEELKKNSIEEKEVLAVVEEEGHTNMTPIYEYLTEEILPEEKRKTRATRHKAGGYAVTNGILYKKSFLRPWLRCAGPLQANYVLREIHEGSCSMHAERANRSLGEGIKARLDERSKNWLEEISHVLWAHRTMIKSSNGETSFSLTYGVEPVFPIEIGMTTLRSAEVDMIKNNEALGINLDLLEEKREHAAIEEAKSKAEIEKYYNARVRSTSFRLGDLVYLNNKASHAKDEGKLEPKWEGAYEVTKALGKGAYNGNTLPRK